MGEGRCRRRICKMFARRKKFPALAVIVLIFALAWLLSDLGYWTIDIPWIPVMLIVIAIGWIVNRYAS
jgi:hypothetical protein